MLFGDELFGVPSHQIMDPVHGGIPLFSHEEAVLDHPLLQRLRFVLQNDMLFLVFPGATHTRFQHSIGAMHVAGRAFKALIRSYLADPRRATREPITDGQQRAIQYLNGCLRLAALLHDVGHAPFSHQFEQAAFAKQVFDDPETSQLLWPGGAWAEVLAAQPKQLTHEHYSIWGAQKILRDTFATAPRVVEDADVISLLEKSDPRPTPTLTSHVTSLLPLFLRPGANLAAVPEARLAGAFLQLFRALISGELDVDKMDYLLRDSFFSGCRYGIYNLDHLLSTLRVGFDLEHEWFGLAVTQKGLGPLEDLVNARFQLYLQLYSHKTVVGFKWLLQHAIAEVLSDVATQQQVRIALSNFQGFSHFTDTFFWERFRAYAASHPDSASDRLVRRQRLDFLLTEKDLEGLTKKQVASRLKKAGHRKVAMWESEAKFSKISTTYEHLRVLVEDRITGARVLDEVKRHSGYFEKFKTVVLTHCFIDPL